ncbi:hypothetical protein [Streptomyces kaempferi]|uniref:Uncharacterized protein n=1 Tax=Streptomyces kaempferi TaxID=333725 RepID=A0ABW3XWI6_9ACTN
MKKTTPSTPTDVREHDRLHSLLAPAWAQGTPNTVVISAIGKTALAVH